MIREAVKHEFELKLYESGIQNEKEQAALKIKQLKNTFFIISAAALLIMLIVFYFRFQIRKNRKNRDLLLSELEELKSKTSPNLISESNKFELNRDILEKSISRKLNETDWNVLNILIENPVATNKEIANKAFLSVDGIGSSLRRMYDYFKIKETKYKKMHF